MGTPDSEVNAATEMNVDGLVFWFATSPCFSIHGVDKLSKFPINPNDRLKIQSVAFESVT